MSAFCVGLSVCGNLPELGVFNLPCAEPNGFRDSSSSAQMMPTIYLCRSQRTHRPDSTGIGIDDWKLNAVTWKKKHGVPGYLKFERALPLRRNS
jgi:hypothetical protein